MNSQTPRYVSEGDLVSRIGDAGVFLLEKKYLPKDDDGKIIATPAHRFYQVARAVAGVERGYGASDAQVEKLTHTFYDMMSQLEFLPGGRILANAATDVTALANCYVLPIEDDLSKIYGAVHQAAIIHKNGGGTGYNFSKLRPRGSKVKKGVASGPVSFAGQFDKETEVINSGNRRGANMGILNVDHPDIFEFIRAKFEEEKLSNFNVSVGITDEFMAAYRAGQNYPLRFNGAAFTSGELEKITYNLDNEKAGADVGRASIPASLRVEGTNVYHVYPQLDPNGRVICYGKGKIKTNKEKIGIIGPNGEVLVSAKTTLEIIARYAHASGEPGIIFLDAMDRDNMLRQMGRLDTTNPCGEQPLHPYDACNLGSINLAAVVDEKGRINYQKLEKITRYAVRFLDNVIDLNKGPIKEIEETMQQNRRMGLGVMGWADMLMKLRVGYDSPQALKLAESVMTKINNWAMSESTNLANEKGAFPRFGISEYAKNGSAKVRNLARTTIAPTGSISMVAGVNGGIEPYFGLFFYKEMRGGDYLELVAPEFEAALRQSGFDDAKVKKTLDAVRAQKGSCQHIRDVPQPIKDAFRTAHDIAPEDHIKVQAAFQRHVDNAISKTINLTNGASVEDILDAYVLAHEMGCKGMTVYRDGSRKVQVLGSVLMEEEGSRPRLSGTTIQQMTPHGKAFITLNVRKNEPTRPHELFINIGKGKADIGAIAEGYGRLLSLAFKKGIPLEEIIDQLGGIPGETQVGIGAEKVVSLPDAIARALAQAYSSLSGKTIGTKNGENEKPAATPTTGDFSGNFCPDCGSPLRKVEGCTKCSKCAYSRC